MDLFKKIIFTLCCALLLSCNNTTTTTLKADASLDIKDSTALIKMLHPEEVDEWEDISINFHKPVRLYGSNGSFLFIETILKEPASFIEPAGRRQYLLNESQMVLTTVNGSRFLAGDEYYFKTILPNENPFLIVTEVTNKGSGVHHFYGIENNKIKDFLSNDGWEIQTIGRKSMQALYDPRVLDLSFEDVNADTFPDAIFKGTLVPDPVFSNATVKSGFKNKIKYVFLYNRASNMFEFYEQSSFQTSGQIKNTSF